MAHKLKAGRGIGNSPNNQPENRWMRSGRLPNGRTTPVQNEDSLRPLSPTRLQAAITNIWAPDPMPDVPIPRVDEASAEDELSTTKASTPKRTYRPVGVHNAMVNTEDNNELSTTEGGTPNRPNVLASVPNPTFNEANIVAGTANAGLNDRLVGRPPVPDAHVKIEQIPVAELALPTHAQRPPFPDAHVEIDQIPAAELASPTQAPDLAAGPTVWEQIAAARRTRRRNLERNTGFENDISDFNKFLDGCHIPKSDQHTRVILQHHVSGSDHWSCPPPLHGGLSAP
ncbi:hypothetical protein PCANC_08320 [Puccinia coronata f. sp. avenae]|uniref:Uncharacterized protein n=1 Tax=Puccinia coronata f. sp. avenae TaxID=200324 RepID=A0A2N5T4K1_9BASI|nr:hypothetical protein PCANC_08320 [Puccinia coronata f. sp. avenae]